MRRLRRKNAFVVIMRSVRGAQLFPLLFVHEGRSEGRDIETQYFALIASIINTIEFHSITRESIDEMIPHSFPWAFKSHIIHYNCLNTVCEDTSGYCACFITL